jgi:hypothetical protein
MKTEEHKQGEARWNRSNLLEERKLQIEEKRLLWDQEQKIMLCDVSKLDDAQRTYVLAMRSQIAKEMASMLSFGGSSAGDGDGELCLSKDVLGDGDGDQCVCVCLVGVLK